MAFIPVGDDNSGRTGVPVVTILLVALNVLAFLGELLANANGELESFVRQWSVVPASYTGHAAAGAGPVPWTLLSAMFLHGGWAHLIGNMVYLWIFGDNVEWAFGSLRFLLFYLLCGIAASFAHIVTDPSSTVPSLGASGAISGVLAAYLILFPGNRVMVWYFFRVMAVPAMVVIGFWIVFQFLAGAGSLLSTREGGGIAYFAHVGGFVAGALLTFLFRRRQARFVGPT